MIDNRPYLRCFHGCLSDQIMRLKRW